VFSYLPYESKSFIKGICFQDMENNYAGQRVQEIFKSSSGKPAWFEAPRPPFTFRGHHQSLSRSWVTSLVGSLGCHTDYMQVLLPSPWLCGTTNQLPTTWPCHPISSRCHLSRILSVPVRCARMLWLLAWPHVAGDPDQWQSVRGINHREGPQKNTASHPPSGARDPQIMRCGLY